MLNNLMETIENIIPLLKEKRQAEELALKAEATVRELSGLPTINFNDRNIISVLKSTCLLLERFQEHPELLNQKVPPIPQTIQEIKIEEVQPPSASSPIPQIVIPTLEDKTREEVQLALESSPIPKIIRETTQENPSVTAQELMRLRDWVLLAKSGEGEESTSPKVLDAIYKQLGKILEKEGITSLEETGSFNYERQQVISTQVTDDPQKDDLICDTIRPGYLFHDSLIRPQEVIVYTYQSSMNTLEIS